MKYPGWPKPLSSAVGRTVRAQCDIRNIGGDGVRAGAIGVVTRVHGGVHVTFEKCASCGSVLRVNGLSPSHVALLPEAKEEIRL